MLTALRQAFSVLLLLVAVFLADVGLGNVFIFGRLPEVEPVYLGEYCVDPGTDGDLESCFGLSPFSEWDALRELGVPLRSEVALTPSGIRR